MPQSLMVPLTTLSVDRQRAYWRKKAAQVEAMAEAERVKREKRAEWLSDPNRKNDRPLIYIDKNGKYPIVIVSNGEMYRQDMANMARKNHEKENMLAKYTLPNISADLHDAADRKLRNSRGVTVFHISNNPLAREI